MFVTGLLQQVVVLGIIGACFMGKLPLNLGRLVAPGATQSFRDYFMFYYH
jgi:hypothetical protein